MTVHVLILTTYSLALMALGLWIGRRVRDSTDFFVAGRRLGPGLIFSTMLAANIGAGSTVGATGLAYQYGVSAWWWVGSAAIGSAVLAFGIGPTLRREAEARRLQTVGDYLEHRYSCSVRGIVAVLLWLGSIAILAGQLIAMGTILAVVAGVPFVVGCTLGGFVVSAYFAAGGLLTSAWVNVVQLTVKLFGFAVAVPLALSAVGGWRALSVGTNDPSYWTFLRTDAPGVAYYLALLVPAFIVSPGLLQKILGARDDRSVRLGVGLNALGLFAYAGVPVLVGVIARTRFPDLGDEKMALPMILLYGVPSLAGAVGLAAVFSAELSAADAVVLMLTTSLAQDLYRRFLNPSADDRQVLRVARWTTVASGVLGVALAIRSASIVKTLEIFYTLLGVTLFVPIVAGLYVRRTSTVGALASIAAGLVATLAVHVTSSGAGWGSFTPALAGLAASIAAWLLSLIFGVR